LILYCITDKKIRENEASNATAARIATETSDTRKKKKVSIKKLRTLTIEVSFLIHTYNIYACCNNQTFSEMLIKYMIDIPNEQRKKN